MPQAYIGGILDAATIFLIELKHLENFFQILNLSLLCAININYNYFSK